jgi:hypothetical protein
MGVDATRVVHLPLRVPRPEGEEPQAQRFRVPDLVWYPYVDRSDDGILNEPIDPRWGFIALLSSENAEGPKRHAHHWLLRFDPEGAPLGTALDLDALVPDPALSGRNWEGLDWWEEGSRLVVTYENLAEDDVFYALIVDLPPEWRSVVSAGAVPR